MTTFFPKKSIHIWIICDISCITTIDGLRNLWGSDAFMEIMVQTIRKLEGLKRDTSDARQKYLRVLEHISDASNELVDHALRVTMLLVSDQHAEFEQLVAKEGPMTLKLLSKPYFRHNSVYWATDLGQVLQAALVRSDPQRFKPTGTGDLEIDGQTVTAARVWSLWTDELRTVKRYEYSSPEEARQVFETCRCCTVLVGPEGQNTREKSRCWSCSTKGQGKTTNSFCMLLHFLAWLDGEHPGTTRVCSSFLVPGRSCRRTARFGSLIVSWHGGNMWKLSQVLVATYLMPPCIIPQHTSTFSFVFLRQSRSTHSLATGRFGATAAKGTRWG